jgi:hypothetical protein
VVVTQNIPNTRITGPQTFVFTNTPAGANDALVTIDRMVTPGGLDTLAPGTSLVIGVERSYDGGTTWEPPISITCQGGHIVTVKNGVSVTLTKETLDVGFDADNTGFRVTLDPSAPVRIAGTVVYSP